MTDALTIGWTRAQAATARTAYRRLLAFNLIVQTTVGPIALFAPVWLARQADLPSPLASGWVQLWGVMLLITASLYCRAALNRYTCVGRTSSASSRASSWPALRHLTPPATLAQPPTLN